MERLEREVRGELARFGAPGAMPELLDAWPAAVGEPVAANAWPARIARDGTLHVSTSSASWAFELSQLAPTMLERLRAVLGESAPKALRFAVGPLPEPTQPSTTGESRGHIPVTPEALQRAAELTARLPGGELRDRVAKAAALGLSRRHPTSPSDTL
jgi:hypothetical protein